MCDSVCDKYAKIEDIVRAAIAKCNWVEESEVGEGIENV